MSKKFFKVCALVTCIAALAACSGNNTGTNEAVIKDDVTFPVSEEITLRYWQPMNSKLAASLSNIGEMEAVKKLQEITGIKLEYESPAVGQDSEQFNLLIASKNLPDIIFYKWIGQSQTPDKYMEDGIIQDLTPYAGNAIKNLIEILDNDPHTKKEVTDGSGRYFMFPLLKMDKNMRIFRGFIARQDWLDKLGLKTPTNADELYTVLKAFKEKDPNGNGQSDEIPLASKKSDTITALMAMFRANTEFILKDGKVVYGPTQSEFKDALTYMNKLYTEGLLDIDYAITDDKGLDAKMTSGTAGMVYTTGGNLNKYQLALQNKNAEHKLVALPLFIAPDGKSYTNNRVIINANNGYGTAITRDNKYPYETAMLLDYFYSEEGNKLFNYGVEGLSYTVDNGTIKFTDLVMNDENGKAPGEKLLKYAYSDSAQCGMVVNPDLSEKLRKENALNINIDVWKQNVGTDHLLPTMSYTLEENSRSFAAMSDIKTYRDEMIDKFIMGTEPLEKFDDFVAQLKTMGIDDMGKIQSDAYERFQIKN